VVANIVVEAPNVLCARALADRTPTSVRSSVEAADGDTCGVRIRCAEEVLPGVLRAIEAWLSDYAVDSVALTLDGRRYTLAAPAASVARPRDPDELPHDVVVDA
jgi:hypothetical protein